MRIAVVTLSSLGHDSRVQRTSAALADAGHEVCLIGRPPAPNADKVVVSLLPQVGGGMGIRLGLLTRHAPAQIMPASARPLYWTEGARRKALTTTLAFRPDLIIANDWNTLPIAARAKALIGARVLYDSHEFATSEFADRRLWRLLAQRHVAEIEARFIRSVDAITTVSANIAAELVARYRLATAPTVLRNIPDFEPRAARPTGEQVTVLFHGLFRPYRGIEELIDSVALWRPEWRLVLRGYGASSYAALLAARAKGSAAADRIAFDPPVAPEQVVPAAAAADIGFFALPGSSPQSHFALPNKIFEYIGASLAVVTTPLADMRALLDEWGCGAYTGETAAAIAQTLNALDRASIDRLKARSARAAQSLNWKRESAVLLETVAGIVGRH